MVLAKPKRLQYNNLTKSHKHAPKMEKALAKRLGGVTVKGSGNGMEKGDVRVRNILRVEAKCTSKKSFTVTREMVEKIEAAALSSGELPAIEIEFLDVRGTSTHRVALVPTYVLEMIVAERKEALGTLERPVTDERPPASNGTRRIIAVEPGVGAI